MQPQIIFVANSQGNISPQIMMRCPAGSGPTLISTSTTPAIGANNTNVTVPSTIGLVNSVASNTPLQNNIQNSNALQASNNNNVINFSSNTNNKNNLGNIKNIQNNLLPPSTNTNESLNLAAVNGVAGLANSQVVGNANFSTAANTCTLNPTNGSNILNLNGMVSSLLAQQKNNLQPNNGPQAIAIPQILSSQSNQNNISQTMQFNLQQMQNQQQQQQNQQFQLQLQQQLQQQQLMLKQQQIQLLLQQQIAQQQQLAQQYQQHPINPMVSIIGSGLNGSLCNNIINGPLPSSQMNQISVNHQMSANFNGSQMPNHSTSISSSVKQENSNQQNLSGINSIPYNPQLFNNSILIRTPSNGSFFLSNNNQN